MKKLYLILFFICFNCVHAQVSGEYSLKKLSQLDSVPYEKVTGLSIDYSELQYEWIPIVSNLVNVGSVSISYSDKNLSKLYEKDLSAAIGEIDSLKSISFHFDSLETIPFLFENSEQVKDLYINGEYLGEIPESIKYLKNLELFRFSVNNFDRFPKELSKLKNLEMIDIYSKKLKTFPSCIGKLEKLVSFHLVSDKIKVIPDVWNNLYSLKELYFSCPNLQKMEGSMVELKNLTALEIKKAFNLINLPDSLGSLPKLNVLEIEGAWNLQSIGNLGQSNSLDWLFFDSKNLTLFLEEIGYLGQELMSLEMGVFEVMELTEDELNLLSTIVSIELKTDYFVENGPTDYLRLHFRNNVTEEQIKELERVYRVLPQTVKLNL